MTACLAAVMVTTIETIVMAANCEQGDYRQESAQCRTHGYILVESPVVFGFPCFRNASSALPLTLPNTVTTIIDGKIRRIQQFGISEITPVFVADGSVSSFQNSIIHRQLTREQKRFRTGEMEGFGRIYRLGVICGLLRDCRKFQL